MKLNKGQLVWFDGESMPYEVRANDEKFAICTKPFEAKKIVIYTIVNFEKEIRGTENLVFCMGFETTEDCEDALVRLQKGESEISRRNSVILDITKIK